MAPAGAPGAAPAPMSAVAAAEAPSAAVPSDQVVISNPIVDRLANVASALIVGRKLQQVAGQQPGGPQRPGQPAPKQPQPQQPMPAQVTLAAGHLYHAVQKYMSAPN